MFLILSFYGFYRKQHRNHWALCRPGVYAKLMTSWCSFSFSHDSRQVNKWVNYSFTSVGDWNLKTLLLRSERLLEIFTASLNLFSLSSWVSIWDRIGSPGLVFLPVSSHDLLSVCPVRHSGRRPAGVRVARHRRVQSLAQTSGPILLQGAVCRLNPRVASSSWFFFCFLCRFTWTF